MARLGDRPSRRGHRRPPPPTAAAAAGERHRAPPPSSPPAAGRRRSAGAEVAELARGARRRRRPRTRPSSRVAAAAPAGRSPPRSPRHGAARAARPPSPEPPLAAVERRRPGVRRDLAVGVDVVDPDLDLVAEVEHVLDPVDALAAAQLGDVDQAVAAREDVDERTELGDVDDPARGRSAPTSAGGRVEDQLDLALGLGDRVAVGASRWSPCRPCRRRRR